MIAPAGNLSLAFFEQLLESFEQARSRTGGPFECKYQVGSRKVLLRLAGPALIPPTGRALQHLAVERIDDPDLTICCWDSASSGVRMPGSPWGEDDYLPRGEIRGFNTGRIRASFNIYSCILNILDLSRGIAIWWKRNAKNIPFYERAAPFRQTFHWWMQGKNRHLVHSAAVGTDDGCVLLAGKGGTGKSTAAITGIIDGMSYLADDYILLEDALTLRAHSIYCSAKIEASHLANFPQLRDRISNIEELDREKAIVYLHEIYPKRLIHELPVKAILLPRITGKRETVLRAASPAQSLVALAPSTIFQQSGAGSRDFDFLADVVRRVPSFVLEAGTDLTRIPEAIRSIPVESRL